MEFSDPLDDLFADLARPSELDSLRAFHGECVPGSLTDQPALELRERREHRCHHLAGRCGGVDSEVEGDEAPAALASPRDSVPCQRRRL